MTPLLDRIRAHGGEVIREGWSIRLRPGRLDASALEWLRGRKDQILREVWPEFDDWSERAAIREYDGGLPRDEAEKAAYKEVMGC